MPSSPSKTETAFRALRRTLVLPLLLLSLLSVAFTVQVLVLRDLQRWVDPAIRSSRRRTDPEALPRFRVGAAQLPADAPRDFRTLQPIPGVGASSQGTSLPGVRQPRAGGPPEGTRARMEHLGASESRSHRTPARRRGTWDRGREARRARMDSLRAMVHLRSRGRRDGPRGAPTTLQQCHRLLAARRRVLALTIGSHRRRRRRQLLALSARYEEAFDTQRRQTDVLRHREWVEPRPGGAGRRAARQPGRGRRGHLSARPSSRALPGRQGGRPVRHRRTGRHAGTPRDLCLSGRRRRPPASLRPGSPGSDRSRATGGSRPCPTCPRITSRSPRAPARRRRVTCCSRPPRPGDDRRGARARLLEPPAAGAVEYLERRSPKPPARRSGRRAIDRTSSGSPLGDPAAIRGAAGQAGGAPRLERGSSRREEPGAQRAHAQTEAQQGGARRRPTRSSRSRRTLRGAARSSRRGAARPAREGGAARARLPVQVEFLANMSHELHAAQQLADPGEAPRRQS